MWMLNFGQKVVQACPSKLTVPKQIQADSTHFNTIEVLLPTDAQENCFKRIIKGKSNKMQQCIKILLFHIYMKLNMFRATHRPSSGA